MSSPLRLIVADDSAVFRSALCQYLSSLKSVTVLGEAEDGIQALEMVNRLSPDVLLLDLSMPRMDGYAVLQHLHAQESSVSVIILTGHPDAYFEQLLKQGAVACIEKHRAPLLLAQTFAHIKERKSAAHST
ncbi:MAG: response regulator [Caldilineaceae bacterium]|nr:response regulator [Caldilineaceae bacterium]